MAITFINKSSVASIGLDSLTINKPVDTSQNDLLVAYIVIEDSNDVIQSYSEGWTRLYYSGAFPRVISHYIYYKIAGASEPSTYQWVFNNTYAHVGVISTFRGTNLTTPIGNNSTSTSTSGTTSHIAPSIYIQKEGNLAVFLCGTLYGLSYTEPSGWTKREEIYNRTGKDGITVLIATYEYNSIGNTGDITAVSTNADYFKAGLIELRLPPKRKLIITHC